MGMGRLCAITSTVNPRKKCGLNEKRNAMSALWVARYSLVASLAISLSGFALGLAKLIDPGLAMAIAAFGWGAVAISAVACLVFQGLSWKPKRGEN